MTKDDGVQTVENYSVSVEMEDGLEKILSACRTVGFETVPLEKACGRVLAEDVAAREDIPPFRRSPYDGYALRACDAPGKLKIVEEIPAGCAPEKALHEGEAAKILTGAPLPEGADAIIKFEETEFTDTVVKISRTVAADENVVPVGEDVKRGTMVLRRGERITPASVGIAAGVGCVELKVYKRLRAAIISTGDELCGVGEELRPGRIRNSSAYTLAAFIRRCGADAELYGMVPDDEKRIAAAVSEAAEKYDLVFTTGGVSVGDYDMMRRAMARLEANVFFWKVKMKPGASFLAAEYNGTPLLCLSGNPAAAAVSLFMLGFPAIRKISGLAEYDNKRIMLKLRSAFKKSNQNRRFLPGRISIDGGEAFLELQGGSGNGVLSQLQGCDAVGELPTESGPVAENTYVNAYWLFR